MVHSLACRNRLEGPVRDAEAKEATTQDVEAPSPESAAPDASRYEHLTMFHTTKANLDLAQNMRQITTKFSMQSIDGRGATWSGYGSEVIK